MEGVSHVMLAHIVEDRIKPSKRLVSFFISWFSAMKSYV